MSVSGKNLATGSGKERTVIHIKSKKIKESFYCPVSNMNHLNQVVFYDKHCQLSESEEMDTREGDYDNDFMMKTLIHILYLSY